MLHDKSSSVVVVLGVFIGLVVLAMSTPALAKDPCYGATTEEGPRACDEITPIGDCAVGKREHDVDGTIGS
jgi:hypothetical protein